MNKPIINLFDIDFPHSPSATWTKVPHLFDYVRGNPQHDGITVFVNELIYHSVVDKVSSKYKIAWLLEPPDVKPQIYEYIQKVEHKFDYIMTFDPKLLSLKNPKYVFIPYAGCWINEDKMAIYPKTKDCSMLYSAKQFCEGHKLRHLVAAEGFQNLDLFGAGANKPIQSKEEALNDYRFSIIIENQLLDNFFTEKLIDTFATGTIPIYWGCPNIDQWFNPEGILQFQTIEDLKHVMSSLSNEEYEKRLPAIKDNFQRCFEYTTIEDWMHKNIFIAKGLYK